jgi:valyl-tRNA synthetase
MSYLIFTLFCLFSVASAMLRSSLLLKRRLSPITSSSSSSFLRLHGTNTKGDNINININTKTITKPSFKSEIESKYFEFDRLEKEVYAWWETNGYFKPKINAIKKPFIIPMPPPNVTGYLHMGHALFVAIQDILTRFHRMRGRPTLWLPGTDHAGIATQLLVERSLTGEGITRQQLGREKFLDRVWQWKGEKGGYITQQMRRLGASADWSREKFTLDDDMSGAVTEAFVRLHEQGLVYRGSYLVNWSPHLQTAVSDLEVEYSEETGTLFHFRYPLADNSGDFIPVATTRPETILGDTAVCVHPEDPRYQKFIGKMVKVPMTDRVIPVIADEVVERDFGTGALKITPAHDPNDYETGKRHNLPLINIMNRDASINAAGGERYTGLDRFECRKKIWEDLTAAGLAIKAESHVQRVPRSQRGGEVIEPLVSAQWFVRTEGMAKRALDVVHSGQMKILPERFEKVWDGWLENIRDWCVSRQLWWGHRIPVYYVDGSTTEYVVARSLDEAHTIARTKYNRDVTLEQDEDVLDTWFR